MFWFFFRTTLFFFFFRGTRCSRIEMTTDQTVDAFVLLGRAIEIQDTALSKTEPLMQTITGKTNCSPLQRIDIWWSSICQATAWVLTAFTAPPPDRTNEDCAKFRLTLAEQVLPNEDHHRELYDNIGVLITRVLVKRLPGFAQFSAAIENLQHIPHQYSDISKNATFWVRQIEKGSIGWKKKAEEREWDNVRESERERMRERQREKEWQTETVRQTEMQTDWQTYRQTEIQTDRQADRKTGRQTDKQQTDRQTDRLTDS